jgi:DNA modification methylase
VSEFRYYIYQEDCLEVLRRAPDNYFDSMVTDPPAGISFMHREWDGNKGGRDHWIDWMCERMQEAYRVLKPGAHALVWALPRTSHWTATALEDAGWEVRDIFTHHFGSGFPKSQDVGKFIDKLSGAERQEIGRRKEGSGWKAQDKFNAQLGYRPNAYLQDRTEVVYTAPATDEAKQWDGWGTGIKPGSEHWILVRKPLSEKSVARNILKWGTGALNIDACRVHRGADDVPGWHKSGAKGSEGYRSEKCPECVGGVFCYTCGGTGWLKGAFVIRDMGAEEIQERCGDKGRWPTNLLLTHSADCDETTCVEDCPVAEINRQSGHTKTKRIEKPSEATEGSTSYAGTFQTNRGARGYTDEGGAARFFPTFRYQAKPSRSERERGLEALPESTLNRVNPGGIENDPRWAPVTVKNNHPTVKSVNLMAYLCRLITPPGGLVLDPFCGSGSTGVACMAEGFRFVGIDGDEHYCQIAQGRIEYAANDINKATEDLSLTQTESEE